MRLNATCAARCSRIRTLTSIICATLMGFIRVNKYFPPTDSFPLLGRSNWCDICSKSVVNFKRHMHDVHGTNNEVVCEYEGCGKVLKNAASWKYHLRNSHGVYQSKWFVGQLQARCTPCVRIRDSVIFTLPSTFRAWKSAVPVLWKVDPQGHNHKAHSAPTPTSLHSQLPILQQPVQEWSLLEQPSQN